MNNLNMAVYFFLSLCLSDEHFWEEFFYSDVLPVNKKINVLKTLNYIIGPLGYPAALFVVPVTSLTHNQYLPSFLLVWKEHRFWSKAKLGSNSCS